MSPTSSIMDGGAAATSGSATYAAPIRLRVLFVCTANLCRSPLAEHLLRDRLGELVGRVEVRSAGVQAVGGQPMHEHVATVLDERGVGVDPNWVTRRFDASVAADADLILTAAREHRRHVLTQVPAATRRTFTIIDFARLLELGGTTGDQDEDWASALLARAAAGRAQPQERDGTFLDIRDPMGRAIGAFRDCAAILEPAAEAMATALSACH